MLFGSAKIGLSNVLPVVIISPDLINLPLLINLFANQQIEFKGSFKTFFPLPEQTNLLSIYKFIGELNLS